MAIQVLQDPFASSAQTKVSEQGIRSAAPSMPDTKVQDLIRSANKETWDKQEGVNEKFLFDKQLTSIASTISAQLGPFALDAYSNGQNVIEAATLRILNEGDRTGSFRGMNARGGSQWSIQQVTPSSFSGSATDRVYSTGTTGNFDIIPNYGGAATNATQSLNTDTQASIFLGYFSTTNPRAVDQVQLGVNDGVNRQASDVYVRENLGTLQAFNAGTVEYITDNDNFDLNGSATQDVNTDLFPFGVNIDTASNLPSLSVQS